MTALIGARDTGQGGKAAAALREAGARRPGSPLWAATAPPAGRGAGVYSMRGWRARTASMQRSRDTGPANRSRS